MLRNNNNNFYRVYQPLFIIVLMGAILVTIVWASIVMFQMYHRPLPSFYAVQPDGKRMWLQPQDLPHLTPDVILRFANKAAVAAYTFDFVNYQAQINAARVYFTDAGWNDYKASVSTVIEGITRNKLFVTGVVNGALVISNEGELNGVYSWRVQIPFLVTYQSAQSSEQRRFTVLATIIRVPTVIDPLGVGIDQFVMT